MGNVGGGEILVILLVALIFLGPEKLPEVARQLGKVMGEVRKVKDGFQREIRDAMRVIEESATELDVGTEPGAADELPAVTEPGAADELPAVTEPGAADELPAVTEVDSTIAEVGPSPAGAADGPALPADAAHGGDR